MQTNVVLSSHVLLYLEAGANLVAANVAALCCQLLPFEVHSANKSLWELIKFHELLFCASIFGASTLMALHSDLLLPRSVEIGE